MADTHPRIVIVPGWRDSGPAHWQSLWQQALPQAERVVQDDWLMPRRAEWVAALEALILSRPEPVVIVAPTCNGGMAIVVGKNTGITTFKGLKDKRIGILPGSTQEAVFNDRLKAEGMTIKDVKSVRVSFSEMASALERGDIDAFVGAEPGPSISAIRGVGTVLEFPYSTPTGSVNMVMTTHADTVNNNAELAKVFLEIHRKASEYAMANRKDLVAMAGAKLGLPADVANLAADNVELTWKIDEDWKTRSQYYGSLMLERKQIRKLPDYSKFIVTSLNPKS